MDTGWSNAVFLEEVLEALIRDLDKAIENYAAGKGCGQRTCD